MLLAAVAVDGKAGKHPLGVIEGGGRERRRGAGPAGQPDRARLDPKVCRLCATRRSSAARSTRPAI